MDRLIVLKDRNGKYVKIHGLTYRLIEEQEPAKPVKGTKKGKSKTTK